MSDIKLKEDLVNQILQYLSNKPYGEVVQLINEIIKQAQSSAGETTAQQAVTVE